MICNKIFTPSKYRPEKQVTCSDVSCQHKRQLDNMKKWRKSNPHYFRQDEIRGAYWHDMYKRRIKKWRKENPDYFKNYRQKYKDRHREYMKEYMRRYRTLKKRSSLSGLTGVQAVQQVIQLPAPPEIA